MPDDPRRWFEANRWAGDAVLATGFLLVLTFLGLSTARGPIDITMTLVLVLPLYFRRTAPEIVTIVVAALCFIQLVLIPYPVAGDLVVPVVVYTAAAYIRDRRWGYFALGAGLAGSVAGAYRWWVRGYGGSITSYLASSASVLLLVAVVGSATVVAAYLAGVGRRDRLDRAVEQQDAEAERERLRTAERDSRYEVGAAAERARIARELHDIVAHALSVIVIQADGGAAAARTRPEVGPQVLETIAATSRDALAQMRRMVSVLRAGPTAGDAVDYAPAPGPADLSDLVAQETSAGVPTDLDVIGSPRPVSEDAGLIIYRVVQESLTNVLKHAGPSATCRVVLHYGPDQVFVTVTDDGRGAATAPDGLGHGLEGMRERVALAGGTVHAGPRLGGGFEVTATVPAPRAGGSA